MKKVSLAISLLSLSILAACANTTGDIGVGDDNDVDVGDDNGFTSSIDTGTGDLTGTGDVLIDDEDDGGTDW